MHPLFMAMDIGQIGAPLWETINGQPDKYVAHTLHGTAVYRMDNVLLQAVLWW